MHGCLHGLHGSEQRLVHFHEDNVDCILCHRVGRAHYMQLYNDANRRVDDYMGVGTFHVNPFAGSHYMFQNTGDHIEALLHTLTGTGHIQGCRCNAFQCLVTTWKRFTHRFMTGILRTMFSTESFTEMFA